MIATCRPIYICNLLCVVTFSHLFQSIVGVLATIVVVIAAIVQYFVSDKTPTYEPRNNDSWEWTFRAAPAIFFAYQVCILIRSWKLFHICNVCMILVCYSAMLAPFLYTLHFEGKRWRIGLLLLSPLWQSVLLLIPLQVCVNISYSSSLIIIGGWCIIARSRDMFCPTVNCQFSYQPQQQYL